MTNEVKNVPEIRFPEFSDCWQEKQLGELASVTKLAGFEFTKYVKYSDFGEIPAIRGLNVKNGDFVFSDVKYIDDSDFSKLSRSKLESDNIVYTYVGTIGDAAIVPVNKLWYLAPNVAKIVTKNIEPKFLLQILLDSNFKKKEVLSWISTSSQPALSMTNIRKFKMQIPKSSIEQEKIGDFFSKLDQQIELEEKKLELLEQQKRGYMQDIFSLKLRFKDNNGNDYPEWEEKKLEDLADIVRGASPRPIKDSKWFDSTSEVGWLRISDVTNQNGKIYNLEQRLSLEGQLKTRVIASPHLLLSIAASVGKPVINFVKTGVHDGFLIFLNPKFNLIFMYNWLEMFKPKWQKYGQPGSQVNLNSELVKSQIITIPNYYEQQKIGDFFNKLDEIINNQSKKINTLKLRKQGFLQKIFV